MAIAVNDELSCKLSCVLWHLVQRYESRQDIDWRSRSDCACYCMSHESMRLDLFEVGDKASKIACSMYHSIYFSS